ncbi:hypothetical protein E1B28_004401 [Marasmius oreades]|uniref:ThrRS/AlaRS common domain-containing protein n=1 Tax=Marasmius oreades TaxID=181124 RepID=A0A9P7UYK0_9AGAR|nr:uncharacterized protein E1B28_004401 [Marasmius oreades]KAG7097007.1 hypothetical protein E1B28_004401 [Marasmius oreades]
MAATVVPPSLPPSATPQDYFRIVSPTLIIPRDPKVSIPVGILACQRDPLLRSIETTIVSCTVYQPPPSTSKKTKNAVSAPTLPDDPILHVTLHDTVVFPEGGGQPTDTGVISTREGKNWRVLQVKRHGGHAVHYVHVEDGDLEGAMSAFVVGLQVIVHLADTDFDRRYDHMSMHTSQHLLSALLETRLNLPTLSWSLTSSPTPCYVEIPRILSGDEIQLIQNEANRLVFEGRRVHVEVEELNWADEKGVDILENGRAVGKTLPQDYTGGVKRVVVIDGVDRNPCCGTHLPSINNLQLFLLPQTETISRTNVTSSRLFFLCGPRLLTYLASSHSVITDTGFILSCGTRLVPARVAQIVEERKRAEKRINDLELELSMVISDSMVSEAINFFQGSEAGLFKKYMQRTDDAGSALSFLSSIAFSFSGSFSERSLAGRFLIVLSSSPSSQSATSTTLVMVFGSEDSLVKQVSDRLKTQLSVKGGGKGLRWSGKYTGVWKNSREGAGIVEMLTEV